MGARRDQSQRLHAMPDQAGASRPQEPRKNPAHVHVPQRNLLQRRRLSERHRPRRERRRVRLHHREQQPGPRSHRLLTSAKQSVETPRQVHARRTGRCRVRGRRSQSEQPRPHRRNRPGSDPETSGRRPAGLLRAANRLQPLRHQQHHPEERADLQERRLAAVHQADRPEAGPERRAGHGQRWQHVLRATQLVQCGQVERVQAVQCEQSHRHQREDHDLAGQFRVRQQRLPLRAGQRHQQVLQPVLPAATVQRSQVSDFEALHRLQELSSRVVWFVVSSVVPVICFIYLPLTRASDLFHILPQIRAGSQSYHSNRF